MNASATETTTTVEWYDAASGQWYATDDDPRDADDAVKLIADRVMRDFEVYRYRIVTTTTREV